MITAPTIILVCSFLLELVHGACPAATPYEYSGTCYACPSDAPYGYMGICYVSCPPEAPLLYQG